MSRELNTRAAAEHLSKAESMGNTADGMVVSNEESEQALTAARLYASARTHAAIAQCYLTSALDDGLSRSNLITEVAVRHNPGLRKDPVVPHRA